MQYSIPTPNENTLSSAITSGDVMPFTVRGIEVYTFDFTLLEMSPAYVDFRWRRRFSGAGEFQLTTMYTQEQFELFKPDRVVGGQVVERGNILYNRNTNEIAYITSRHFFHAMDGRMMLVVRGYFGAVLLNRRVINVVEGRYTLLTLLQQIINNNFMAAADNARNIPNLRLLPMSLPNISMWVSINQRNAYAIITDWLIQERIGVRLDYSFDRRFLELLFYQPTSSKARFSMEFGNLTEQEVWEDTANYRNVALVGENFTQGNATGFNRREVSTAAPREGTETPAEAARGLLGRNSAVQDVYSVINVTNPQFVYMQDWDLGSIVTVENRELGIEKREIVSVITEMYSVQGRNIEVTTVSEREG